MDRITEASDANRRVLPRIPAGLKVDYKYGSHVAQGMTADISEGGIFLLSNQPASPGTKIYIHLHLKNGTPPMKIIGHVRRSVESSQAAQPGMGISFEVIYANDSQQLKDFVGQTLGIKVTESSVAAVKGTGAFKHVIDPPPVRPKPGVRPDAKAVSPAPAPAKRRHTPEQKDRYNLKQLDFHDNSWMKRRLIGWAIGLGALAGTWFAIQRLIAD